MRTPRTNHAPEVEVEEQRQRRPEHDLERDAKTHEDRCVADRLQEDRISDQLLVVLEADEREAAGEPSTREADPRL